MQETMFLVGFSLIFIGIILILISSIRSAKVEYAFGGFIGPIPFGWANTKQGLVLIIILLFLVAFLLYRLRF
ncbi:MAG: hypothetical protein N3D75_01940 [Candidatus Aenigmarchaeota archaeon]|nr:hypothetical protein [Candidatus Aenigmarchaeota archaeon]